MIYDLVVVGGGAAGFFCAIQCAERAPGIKIIILEKSGNVLSKVRVSGGGRCNVTHACFDPNEMILNYPRGSKELLGPFHKFLCGDMMQWLADHGVETKIEEDGRVFPVSDRSESIIECFLSLCRRFRIQIQTNASVSNIEFKEGLWNIQSHHTVFKSRNLLIASGSSVASWKLIKNLRHEIIEPVPSLFTFNIKHPIIKELAGVSLPNATLQIEGTDFRQQGPLLITHWGLSGPAVLKLSAWAARYLSGRTYRFDLLINWLSIDKKELLEEFNRRRTIAGSKTISNFPIVGIPRRLWQNIAETLKIALLNYGDLNARQTNQLVSIITSLKLPVSGKSTFKEEFVTCGGVETSEVDFRTMESKLWPGLFFAGEVLNIDAVTGGFNFQAAWTEAYLAADTISNRCN